MVIIVGAVRVGARAPRYRAATCARLVQADCPGTTASPTGKRTLWFLVAGEFALAVAAARLRRPAGCARSIASATSIPAFRRRRRVDVTVYAARGELSERRGLLSRILGARPEEDEGDFRRRFGRPRHLPAAGLSLGQLLLRILGFLAPGSDPGRLSVPGDAHALRERRSYFKTMGTVLKSRSLLRRQKTDASLTPPTGSSDRLAWRSSTKRSPGCSGRTWRIRWAVASSTTTIRAPWMTVVGLVRDIKHYGLERPMRPGVDTFPLPRITRGRRWPSRFIPSGDALLRALAAVLCARAMRELDPDLPLFQVRTMRGGAAAVADRPRGLFVDARCVRPA